MKFTGLAIFMLLSASVIGQDSPESRINEATAWARLNAAELVVPITSKQCAADMSSWAARNEVDAKSNGQAPQYWYDTLSTEELARMSSESTACAGQANTTEKVAWLIYEAAFMNEFALRSDTILRKHGLIHELLLDTSH
jgi:hypothetical protein